MYPCPCCGYLTLPDAPPGTNQICLVCRWQDDDSQFVFPTSSGGANRVSLEEARRHFAAIGVSDPDRKVRARAPREEEIPPDGAEKGSA